MLHGKIGKDAFLGRDVDLYFHAHYYGFSSSENTLKYINYLKNDRRDYDRVIAQCEDKAATVLAADLAELVGNLLPGFRGRRRGGQQLCGREDGRTGHLPLWQRLYVSI